MAVRRSACEQVRCNICRSLLPCRIPRHEAADRCGPCQQTFWETTRAAGNCRPVTLPPLDAAKREARIQEYERRAEAKLPLFPEQQALAEAC